MINRADVARAGVAHVLNRRRVMVDSQHALDAANNAADDAADNRADRPRALISLRRSVRYSSGNALRLSGKRREERRGEHASNQNSTPHS